ncbi:unnamed protein product, partial [Brassica rapa subsp. trilocularis]
STRATLLAIRVLVRVFCTVGFPTAVMASEVSESSVRPVLDTSNVQEKHLSYVTAVKNEVEFIYPWLSDKCTICSKWGHTHKACKLKVKILTRQNTSVEERVVPVQDGNVENSPASSKENSEKEVIEEVTPRNVTNGQPDRDREAVVASESPAAERSASVQTSVVETNTEGIWKDVSPSKHGRLGIKPAVQHTNLISPSRFAVLQEEGNKDVREGQDETEEKKETEENETEEGEILEGQADTLEEVSEEISGEVSGDETGTEELLNQHTGKAGKSERGE